MNFELFRKALEAIESFFWEINSETGDHTRMSKRTRIGIVEIYSHHIFLYTLAAISRNDNAIVTIFTTNIIYEMISPIMGDKFHDCKFIIKRDLESNYHFLKRVEKYANDFLDIIFINSIQGKTVIPFYFFKPRTKIVVATGRIDEWFGNRYRLLGLNSFRNYLHHNITNYVLKRMIKRVDAIIVHNKEMQHYALANNFDKPVFVIPFSFFEGTRINKKISNEIKFVITGGIENERRDYNGVLNCFEKSWNSGISHISLTLLGRPIGTFGQKILKRAKVLKGRGFNVRFFKEFILENKYIEEISSADVIISPIKKDYYKYGILTSGVIEAIRQGKPGIYPAGYLPYEELKTSSLFYENVEYLTDLINDNFINNDKRRYELVQRAIINADKFSLDKLKIYFENNIINKYFKN